MDEKNINNITNTQVQDNSFTTTDSGTSNSYDSLMKSIKGHENTAQMRSITEGFSLNSNSDNKDK